VVDVIDIFDYVVPFTVKKMSEEDCCRLILEADQFDIVDVSAGEEPFEYSASTPTAPFYGPGYLVLKAVVGQAPIFFPLVNQMALKIAEIDPPFQVICGNVSGGMTPAFLLTLYLHKLYGERPIYIYAREMRKQHGSKEMLVGFERNPGIKPGMIALDFEELVNRANTTCHAALTLRASGLACDFAATLLDYRNPQAIKQRREIGLNQVSLTTLPVLLDVAESIGRFSRRVIEDYRRFLADPGQWQADNAGVIAKAVARKNAGKSS
jgi:orotate phosphoribosyltransferase